MVFRELEIMANKKGLRYAPLTYQKAYLALCRARKPITSGKVAMNYKGIGKTCASYVQEFLDTGKVSILEEWKKKVDDADTGVNSLELPIPIENLTPIPISAEDKKKLQDAVKRLKPYTRKMLREYLRENDQAMTQAKKDELIERVADGEVFGALPRCPVCGGGKIRFNNKRVYYCPGYMDDDVFQSCTFTSATIKRNPWKKLSDKNDYV